MTVYVLTTDRQSAITNLSNIYVSSNVLCNLAISIGFLYITTQQYIGKPQYNNFYLNNGNITNINGISVNEIIATGKIKEKNRFLDATYSTSNHIITSQVIILMKDNIHHIFIQQYQMKIQKHY
jgi:hypothetical protein